MPSLEYSQQQLDECQQQYQLDNLRRGFDLLIIDDQGSWIELITEACQYVHPIPEYDIAKTVKEALEKIHTGNYKAVCMNVNFESTYHGRNILKILNEKNIPVVLMSGYAIAQLSNLQERYLNVKDIIGKGPDPEDHDAVISKFIEIIPNLLITPQFYRQCRIVTWLHLSDLHFQTSQTYDANVVLQALLDDIRKRIEEERLKPDFIAITGDLAFSGQFEEYDLAKDFFCDLLKITDLPRERLFLVPGNHDVNRKLVNFIARSAGQALVSRDLTNRLLADPVQIKLIVERFNGYAEFVNTYWGGQRAFDEQHYFAVHTLDLAGVKLALLGLNSAWLCASDEDKNEGLLIGERQVREAVKQAKDADLKIALFHHPFDWLREFDQDDSATFLIDNCDFILHGHLHKSAITQLTNPDSGAMVIAGGACYETREYPNLYNFVRLDLEHGQGTIYLRRYADKRGGFWAKDTLTYRNAPNGEYSFNYKRFFSQEVKSTNDSVASSKESKKAFKRPSSKSKTGNRTTSELRITQLPSVLRQRIVDLLTALPNIHESSMRRTVILDTGFDQKLQDLIDVEKPPAQFIPLLLDTLLRYGKLKNGQEALVVLLETAKRYVGKEKQTECDALLQELRDILKQTQD